MHPSQAFLFKMSERIERKKSPYKNISFSVKNFDSLFSVKNFDTNIKKQKIS